MTDNTHTTVWKLFSTAVVFLSFSFLTVHADASLDSDSSQEYEYDWDDECSGCVHGCCGEKGCCDPPSSSSSISTIRIVAVIAGFFITLVLLFLCFVRVRCMAKRSLERRRVLRQMRFGESNRVSNQNGAPFSLNVPPQTMSHIMMALNNIRSGPGSGETPLGEIIVQPPPYSENDPVTPPLPSYTDTSQAPAIIQADHSMILEPPPPYSQVKDEDDLQTQSSRDVDNGGGTNGNENQTETEQQRDGN